MSDCPAIANDSARRARDSTDSDVLFLAARALASLSLCRHRAPLVDGSPANSLLAREDASTGHRLPLIRRGFYFRSRVQSRISVTDEADLPRATNRRREPRWIIAYSFECLASH